MRMLSFLLSAVSFLLPTAAYAEYGLVTGTVDSVGFALPFLMPGGDCFGNSGCGFVEIAEGIIDRFRPLLSVAAVLVIVIAGYRMIIGQEDDAVTKSRALMSGAIAGLVMVWLIDPFIHAFYGSAGEVPQGAMMAGATVLSVEVSGVIEWALTITAALAILMLVVSALKAFGSATGEEGISNMRNTIFTVLFGIALLVIRVVISEAFVMSPQNPFPILDVVMTYVSYLLTFLALAATLVTVYAGFLYVLSAGKEEQATKAKDLLIRAAIGAVTIVVSLALVNFVILREP